MFKNTVIIWYIFRQNRALFQIYQTTILWFKGNWETFKNTITLVYDLYTERLFGEGGAFSVQE